MSHIITLENDSVFFERQLVSFETTWYEQQMKPLNGVRLIPTKVDPWDLAQAVSSRMVTKYGAAAWVKGGALDPQDIPTVGASTTEDFKPVREYATSAIYSYDEINVAQRLGVPLDMWQVQAAMEALNEIENDMVFNGFAAGGLSGLWTSGLIGTTGLTTGDWDTLGVTTTAAQAYSDLLQMANFIEENTSTARSEPVTIVLPVTAYNRVSQTPYSTTDTRSILRVFLDNVGAKVASVESAIEFDAQKEALVFIKNERYMRHHVVMPTQRLPDMQYVNGFKTIWRRRDAGIIVQNSTTQRRFTGILS
jgi:hypothetical protein